MLLLRFRRASPMVAALVLVPACASFEADDAARDRTGRGEAAPPSAPAADGEKLGAPPPSGGAPVASFLGGAAAAGASAGVEHLPPGTFAPRVRYPGEIPVAPSQQSAIVTCTEAAPLSGSETNAAPVIQACIDRTASGGTTLVPRGVYTLVSQLFVTRPIRLAPVGTATDDPGCSAVGDARCVELRADWRFISAETPPLFGSAAIADGAMVVVDADHVTLDHLIFNGDGTPDQRRRSQWAAYRHLVEDATHPDFQALHAQKPHIRGAATTVIVYGKNHDIVGSAFVNGVAYGALQLLARPGVPSEGHRVRRSSFVGNGSRAQGKNAFCDGVLAIQPHRSRFEDDYFAGNTDYHLIFGGCADCAVERLVIEDSADPDRTSHAGIGLHFWPGPRYFLTSDGDYTGTVFHDIAIRFHGGAGIGVDVNSDLWFQDAAGARAVRGFQLGRAGSPVYVEGAVISLRLGTTGGGRVENLLVAGQRVQTVPFTKAPAAFFDSPRDCAAWSRIPLRPIVNDVQSHVDFPQYASFKQYDAVLDVDWRLTGCIPHF